MADWFPDRDLDRQLVEWRASVASLVSPAQEHRVAIVAGEHSRKAILRPRLSADCRRDWAGHRETRLN